MSETLRVRVKGGVLEPLEKLDLPEGKEVLVTIISVSPQGETRGVPALIRNIYGDRRILTRPEPKL